MLPTIKRARDHKIIFQTEIYTDIKKESGSFSRRTLVNTPRVIAARDGRRYFKNASRGKPDMNEPTKEPRKVRENLTAEERERLERYGAIEFKSAGATRKR